MRQLLKRAALSGLMIMGVGVVLGTERSHADPVVVELFTSQGCSACPPADALLAELANDPDILPLALHVDYWDYLGWQDSFALPAATARQKAYASAAGEKMVYTPQIIVQGERSVAGVKPTKVVGAIMAAQKIPEAVQVTVRGGPDKVLIRLRASAPFSGAAEVVLVRFRDTARVEITRGENAGRTFTYHNVVTEWSVLAEWDGTAPLEAEAALAAPLSSAVLVQAPGPGPVLGAARLD